MGIEERRRYKRLAIKMPIIWRREGYKKQNRAEAYLLNVQNITTSGLFLKTRLRPKKGAYINLLLNLNKKPNLIELKGKVVWTAKKKEQPYLYPGIGIEFVNMTQGDYKKLSTFIKNKLINFRDAQKLKSMYTNLKNMASNLVELEERHSSATHFRKVLDNAIGEIDEVAHILDREISEIKKM